MSSIKIIVPAIFPSRTRGKIETTMNLALSSAETIENSSLVFVFCSCAQKEIKLETSSSAIRFQTGSDFI